MMSRCLIVIVLHDRVLVSHHRLLPRCDVERFLHYGRRSIGRTLSATGLASAALASKHFCFRAVCASDTLSEQRGFCHRTILGARE